MQLKTFLGGDYTPLEHGVIAACIQMILTVLLWWFDPVAGMIAGGAAGIGFFCGREHAQAEQKLKRAAGAERISWAMTREALKFWKWPYASRMDLYCPIAAVVCVAVLFLALGP